MDDAAIDITNFADWLFSEDGLPDLKILAWGGFSNEGRCAEHNILFFAEIRGFKFRTLTDLDTYYWDFIDANMDMLAACPADSIMY